MESVTLAIFQSAGTLLDFMARLNISVSDSHMLEEQIFKILLEILSTPTALLISQLSNNFRTIVEGTLTNEKTDSLFVICSLQMIL